MPPTRAVIALGSNLGDRADQLARACDELRALGTVAARSRLFETVPVGPEQPDYLNAVILLDTTLRPLALLDALQAIEHRLGRVRTERWGPRTIDLDLVAYGGETVAEARLTLPHPEATRRAFVLAPLCDVAPDWRFPDGRTARSLLTSLDEGLRSGVRPLERPWPRHETAPPAG